MHQSVEQIIDILIGAVKADKPYYSLKDLLSAGFPPFIVERIRIEVNEKLKREFELHDTIWADTKQKMVKEAWQEFRESLFAQSRIPKEKFYTVTHRVVTEIVKVYLEPRQHMAEYIYKGEDELDYEELVRRTDKLTIYKHFGRAIPLYMEKRKLKTLDKKRCKLLIHNLDANLVAHYSAEEWAQVLELLFTLFSGKIDAKLIQLFFEDKGLYLTAKAFNELDEEITKKRFIEILSYPDLLDVKLQEKFREQFREELIAQKNRFDQPDEEIMEEIDEKEQRLLDSFFGDYHSDEKQMTDEESFNALFKSEQRDKSLFEEFEEVPDADKISKSIKEGHQTDEIKEFRQNLVTVLDQAAHSFKNLSQEEEEELEQAEEKDAAEVEKTSKKAAKKIEPEEAPESEEPNEIADEEEADTDDANETEAEPMWQQFLRPDQMDVLMGKKESEEDEVIIGDEFLGDDVLEDEIDDENPVEDLMSDLNSFLADKEDQFVDEIFKGKEKKFDKALKEIQNFKEWEKAANYLEKKVFSVNKVDMYSEVAVEFTDRLQEFFEKFKS
jgi:hypothetical protein